MTDKAYDTTDTDETDEVDETDKTDKTDETDRTDMTDETDETDVVFWGRKPRSCNGISRVTTWWATQRVAAT